MKKFFPILLGLSLLGSEAVAQTTAPTRQVSNSFASSFREAVRDPQWGKAFAYSFTPLAEVEPKIAIADAEVFKILQPLLETEQFDKARQELERTIRNAAEPNPALVFTLGALYQQAAAMASNSQEAARLTEQAKQQYLAAIKSYKNYLRAHKNLGQLYMQEENFEQAIVHLQRAVELGDNTSVTWGLLGYAYFNMQDLFAAETAIRNAVALDPKNKPFRTILGQVFLQQQRFQEAQSLFSSLLKEDPNNVEYWTAVANTYLGTNDVPQALANLEMVRLMGGAKRDTLMLLGNIYVSQQMFDLAAQMFVDAVSADSQANPQDLVSAATTLANFGAIDDAEVVINAINQAYGNRLQDQDALALLTLESEIAIQRGQGEEAAKRLEEILARDPLNANALNALADYYAALVDSPNGSERQPRDRFRAVQLYERGQELQDENARRRALIGHAQLEVRVNNLQNAVRLLERAIAIRSDEQIAKYLTQIRETLRARTSRG